MKNNYKLKIICLLCVITAAFSSCKKSDVDEAKGLKNNYNKLAAAGDEKWDVLGYGLDVTGDLLDGESRSDVGILDMQRFENDFRDRITTKIDVDKSTVGTTLINSGYSAYDYLRDLSDTKSFDAEGNAKIAGSKKTSDSEKGPDLNFSASLKISNTSQNIKELNSKYSYASVEAQHRVRRIRFTGDVSMDLLKQYLTPEFLNNIETQSADYLVQRYGTHVMLDISIGGSLRFNYHGTVLGESTEDKKTKARMGLSLSVLGIGIKLSPDKSNVEITKVINETRDKDYFGKYYGGTNSGQSISIDKDGNTTENINLASWQQSVNPGNATLIDVGRAVFLYDFIDNPVKKQQVKDAVEKYILDRQIVLLPTLLYEYYNGVTNRHAYSLRDDMQGLWSNYYHNAEPFKAFPTPYKGAVPLYQYYDQGFDNRVLTTNRSAGFGTYRYDGMICYVYTTNVPGSVPVYEFYSSTGGHLYTTNRNASFPGWSYNGQPFYAFPN